MLQEIAIEPRIYSRYISFAGKPLLVRSNSFAILCRAESFFSPWDAAVVPEHPVAELRLMRREGHCDGSTGSPQFRARDYFAMARFSDADTVWFNLRTRRAYGLFSDETISDEFRWYKDILPTILGILAPVIDVVPVHAACLAKGGAGVLLAGRSGVGKSTLTVTLAQYGYSMLADDWTYLAETENNIGAWSVPVPVKLLPDAIDYFPELTSYSCGQSLNGEIAYEVSPQACFKLSRESSCEIRHIVLLERHKESGVSISPITAEEAIDHLRSEIEPLIGPLSSAHRRQTELLKKLSSAACLRASFNASPQEVARAIDRVLRDGAATFPAHGHKASEREFPAPTDMMQRRTPLTLEAKYDWSEALVWIETNSPSIMRAVTDSGFTRDLNSNSECDLHLQLVVEEGAAELNDARADHVVQDGQTTFAEFGRRGWFAFDAETGNGTGFLTSTEHQTVSAYFRLVTSLVQPVVQQSMNQAAYS